MRRTRVGLALLASVLLPLSLSGCKSSTAKGGRPAMLHYAYSPNAELLQGGMVKIDDLRKYLEGQLQLPVEIVQVEGYSPTIEAMRAKRVDMAGFGALGYIIAAKNADAEALVSTGGEDGKLGVYYSVIAVPKNSPYHSIDDLKAHAKDIVFAFADPASTSGNLYPRVYLQTIGIHAEQDFKKVVFANGHLACVMALKAGKVDAGAFSAKTIDALERLGKMKRDDVRVLWTSEGIPNGPTVTVRKDMPQDLKLKIQDAMTHVNERDPELWKQLSMSMRTLSSGVSYIPVTDSDYNGLRHYTEQVRDFNFVEK